MELLFFYQHNFNIDIHSQDRPSVGTSHRHFRGQARGDGTQEPLSRACDRPDPTAGMTPPGIRGATTGAAGHATATRPLKSAPLPCKLGVPPAPAGHPSFAERLP